MSQRRLMLLPANIAEAILHPVLHRQQSLQAPGGIWTTGSDPLDQTDCVAMIL